MELNCIYFKSLLLVNFLEQGVDGSRQSINQHMVLEYPNGMQIVSSGELGIKWIGENE